MPTFGAGELQHFCVEVFLAGGYSRAHADRLSASLIGSNLRGYDSHGVRDVPVYLDALRKGWVVADAAPAILREDATTALVSGNWALGQVAGEFSMRLAIEKAKRSKVAIVGLVQTYTVGRLGEYAEMAAAEDIVGLICCAGFGDKLPRVAPYGSRKAAISTNPFAIGFPSGDGLPIVVDMATTKMAYSRIQHLADAGAELPVGAMLDVMGNPTTNPADVRDGGVLLPFEGHKGSAIAIAVEFLSRVLLGAERFEFEERGGPIFARAGHFILAIDASAFRPLREFLASADSTAALIRSLKPAEGFDRVRTPGQRSQETKSARLRDGIPVPEATWSSVLKATRALGVPAPATK